MNKKDLRAIAQAAAKNIKTEADLNEFRQILTQITVETALNFEKPLSGSTILIHSPPQVMLLGVDLYENFIDLKGITVPSALSLQAAGIETA